MTQLPLTYCAPPRSRATDSIGSHLAGDRMTQSGAGDAQSAIVLGLVRHWPGRTSRELAVLAGEDRYMVARRLPELRANKLVTKGASRVCEVAERRAATWWPVPPELAGHIARTYRPEPVRPNPLANGAPVPATD